MSRSFSPGRNTLSSSGGSEVGQTLVRTVRRDEFDALQGEVASALEKLNDTEVFSKRQESELKATIAILEKTKSQLNEREAEVKASRMETVSTLSLLNELIETGTFRPQIQGQDNMKFIQALALEKSSEKMNKSVDGEFDYQQALDYEILDLQSIWEEQENMTLISFIESLTNKVAAMRVDVKKSMKDVLNEHDLSVVEIESMQQGQELLQNVFLKSAIKEKGYTSCYFLNLITYIDLTVLLHSFLSW